ncbi:unnamed protein product [Moneuplotes crassus]|uniref:DUF4042 domain-containing protein n=2 Tax=Euplotes crassus TaxID=5936 RepID=A0AAD1UU50_EUPCR|nr:unnamed protein product [Moneuplotes crassus]
MEKGRKKKYQPKKDKKMPNQRFQGFLQDSNEEEEVDTSDKTSSVSDFSLGDEKWSNKKINSIFKRLEKEKNQRKITQIIEKALHKIVYEIPDKPELVVKFSTKALPMINLEKTVLDTIKRLRIFDEIDHSCKDLLDILLTKLKGLYREKKNPNGISPKKAKIINEREDCILSFLSYFVFKNMQLTSEDYVKIYQLFDLNYIQYYKGMKGGYHKFKLLRQVFLCTYNIIKKAPEALKDYNVDLATYCIDRLEESLKKPSIGNKSFLKYTEAIFRLLSVILEGFKGRAGYLSDISLRGFVYFIKYLFIGTIFQDKILKTLMIQHSDVGSLPKSILGSNSQEENKGEEMGGYSDSDSNVGSTYTDSLSQDILMKAKTSACSCLYHIFRFGQKDLFNYRYCMFPSFVVSLSKDFIKFHQEMDTDDKWEEFGKLVDERIYNEPSLLYLYLTETDLSFKQSLLGALCSFLLHSPIEKWQGPLEKDGLTDQYHGFKYLELEDAKKGIGSAGFIPLSQLIAHFIRYLHYTLVFLIKKECSGMLLKLFSTLVSVTPWQKMNQDLIRNCMIPHITQMMSCLLTEEETEMDVSIQKNLLLCFASSASLLCPLIFDKPEERSELEGVLVFQDQDTNFVKWLISDLHENTVKRSHEALEVLTTIAKSYPSFFIENWDSFKEYINIEFSVNEVKKTVGILKLLETWISSLNSEIYKLKNSNADSEEENKEEIKLDSEAEARIHQLNFLNLEGCSKTLNKYLNFYVKSGCLERKVVALNILCLLSNEQWVGIFPAKDQEKIIDTILSSKLSKIECTKFIGSCFRIETFYSNPEMVSKMIEKLANFKVEKSGILALRNGWSLGNLCENINPGVMSPETKKILLELLVQYSDKKYKDKVIAHAVRGIGYVFANCDDFSVISENTVLDWKNLFSIIITNIENKSPKVSWNSCVVLREIMNNAYIREQTFELLFSQETIKSLCIIIKENANFKTRIHAVQTLNKLRDYSEYGEASHEVWDAFLCGLQNVTETTDFTDVNYISSLEYHLFSLFANLVTKIQDNSGVYDRFVKFLNHRSRDIESSILNYLRKQYKVTAFSAVYEEEIDSKILLDQGQLKTIKKLQIALETITKMIDEKDEIQVPFSAYEAFSSIAHTDISEFASLDILKVKKTAFDKDQF